jgi:hypothetical protein
MAAVIPLRPRGASFDPPAVDPGGRIAWVGGVRPFRQAYAVDLRRLDDPNLYPNSGIPEYLDEAAVVRGRSTARAPRSQRRPASPPLRRLHLGGARDSRAGTELFATDFCDWNVHARAARPLRAPPVPSRASLFQIRVAGAAIRAQQRGRPAAISTLAMIFGRACARGVPGVDYRSPDVLVGRRPARRRSCARCA